MQLLFCCSLLIYFLFWDSCMRTLCGQPSTLVRQREGIVNFRVFKDVKKQQIEEDKCSDIKSSLAKWTASGAVQWGYERSLMCLCHWKATKYSSWWTSDSQQSFVPVRWLDQPCMFDVLPVSLNQSSFFTFFESSIMRKIEAGSRLGCRACCVSGMACSDGGFVFNTRLVYFVSEQVFPSGAYFKSALLL